MSHGEVGIRSNRAGIGGAWGSSCDAPPGRRGRRLLGVVATAVLAAFGSPAVAGEIPLTEHTIDGAFDGVRSVVAADVDGDGDLDVLGAARNADDVAWWENTAGDGSAWTQHTVDGAFDGAAVAAGDVDGDGDVDVLGAAWDDDDVTWWENTAGDGSAWTPLTIDGTFDGASSVAAADMDGDGDLDVLATARNGDDISWWENTLGDGSAWTPHVVDGAFDDARTVTAADVDGDGDLDLLGAALEDDDVTWWENTLGDGSTWSEHTVDGAFDGAQSVAAADIDGDGDLDVLGAAYYDDLIAWWENTAGDGSAWTEHAVDGAFDGAHWAAAADMDDDGDLDLLGAALNGDAIAWWENTAGDGSAWSEHTVDGAFDGAISVAAADVDGDGDLDVLGAAYHDDDVVWWENTTLHSSAAFPVEHTVDGAFNEARSVAPADIDGDGDVDLVGGAYFDLITWWENTAGDGSTWSERILNATSDGVVSVATADIDGDGHVDVLGAAVIRDAIAWWENTAGDGSAWTEHTVDGAFDGAASVAGGDMDGDGDLDVVGAAVSDDAIAWWENTAGDGSAWTEHTVDGAFDGAASVAAADVDGDGDLDVLGAGRVDDLIAWWENTAGDGSAWTEHTVDGAFDGAASVAGGDVDGDGDLDLLGAASSDDLIAWWENTAGDGSTWTEHTVDGTSDEANSAVGADVDGDGDLDVLGVARFDDLITWWENTAGDGSAWSEHPVDGALRTPHSVAVADVDGDGDLDVLGATAQDHLIAWWENRGGQFALATEDTAPSTVGEGALDDLLEVAVIHRGRSGDTALELVTLELLFEESPGDPLTTGEAQALIQDLRVYLDDGSGAFDVADAMVTAVGSGALALVDGVQTVTFTDGAADVRVEQGTPRTYFVVVELTGLAAVQSPDAFRVTHLTESSSTAEDAEHDLPLSLEFVPDLVSKTVQAVCGVTLSTSHIGEGLDPSAAPTSGCQADRHHPFSAILVAALPASGSCLESWMGTDDDGSVELLNTCSPPPGPWLVTAAYVPRDRVVASQDFTGVATLDGGDSLTVGPAVRVLGGGDLTLRADSVILDDGFSVETDGALTVETPSRLTCAG